MDAWLGELRRDVGGLHRLVLGDLRIGETRAMPQKVLHDDRSARRYIRVGGLAISAGAGHAHLHVLEGRQELGDGIGELDDTVLDQRHRRHRGKRLGHRVDAEDRIGRHGRIRALVLEADGVRIDDPSLAGDHDHRTRQLAVGNLLLEHRGDAPKPLRRHAHLFRRCRGEGLELARKDGQRRCRSDYRRGQRRRRRQDFPPAQIFHLPMTFLP